jgi:hypothetical protein
MLGASLRADQHATVLGHRYSSKDCLVKALSIGLSLSSSAAWFSLAVRMTAQEVVQVAGKDYTQRACYLEALRLDPELAKVWSNLATAECENLSFEHATSLSTR